MNQEKAAEARKALKEIAESTDSRFYNGYSGRCMFGKECVGIVTNYPQFVVEEAAMSGIRGARHDNMGLNYIVYWPDIPAETN